MKIVNKTVRLNADQQLISGIVKHLGDGTLTFDGKKYTAADIVSVLQKRVDVANNVTATKAAHTNALTIEREEVAQTASFVASVRHVLKVMFAKSADALADLGLSPRPRRPSTVGQKVGAVAKALATRAARHTMGRRQRERIHGVVEAGGKPVPPHVATGPIEPVAIPPPTPPVTPTPPGANGVPNGAHGDPR
jgi:hypothetical protein